MNARLRSLSAPSCEKKGIMRTVHLSTVLAAGLSLFSAPGCSSDGGGGGGQTTLTEGVFGTVTDVSGAPIADVSVQVNGVTRTTDENGEFAIQTNRGPATVTYQREGFLPSVRRVTVDDDSPTATRVTLVERAAPVAVNSDTGGMVMGSRNAAVMIEPGTLSDPNGATVSGMVDVYLTPVDPSVDDEVQALTGSFEGRTGNEVSLLESFGIVDVTIMQGGAELDVMTGETLEIRIPAPSAASSESLPTTMPLWSLDEGTGQWVEEGTTTLDEGSKTYVADASHLSAWNADQLADSTCLTGIVVDEDGQPIAGAGVDSVGIDYFGFSYTTTLDDGRFYLAVKKDSQISVGAYHAPDGFESMVIESGGADTDVPPTAGDPRCQDAGTWTVSRAVVELSDGGGGSGLSRGEQACQIVDAAMVTAAFEGTASEGVPGDDAACEFQLTEGGAVESVDVFFFGDESGWAGTRSGFEEFRGGTTDVAGVGDEAFYSNDRGPIGLVVRAGGIIFQVLARIPFDPFEPIPPNVEATIAEDVAELARAIVTDLEAS